jgi:NAD(P)-dependent dehydrogenase (short-subunit alcohol dehydrogenase family)
MIDATANSRPIAVITGAGGGMGRVCASRLADRYALVLCEFRRDALDQIAGQLSDEGADVVATVSGDLGSDAVLRSIVAACANRPLRALVHTAGLSPDTGVWQDILRTNLVATARLLDAIEPLVSAGFAAALIASMARLAVSVPPEALLELLENPLAEDFVQRFAPLLGEDEALFGNPAYPHMGTARRQDHVDLARDDLYADGPRGGWPSRDSRACGKHPGRALGHASGYCQRRGVCFVRQGWIYHRIRYSRRWRRQRIHPSWVTGTLRNASERHSGQSIGRSTRADWNG